MALEGVGAHRSSMIGWSLVGAWLELVRAWVKLGWSLVGAWLKLGWSLVGAWLELGWSLAGACMVEGWCGRRMGVRHGARILEGGRAGFKGLHGPLQSQVRGMAGMPFTHPSERPDRPTNNQQNRTPATPDCSHTKLHAKHHCTPATPNCTPNIIARQPHRASFGRWPSTCAPARGHFPHAEIPPNAR
eukprot:366197-Chlamydomonas_euryale.AAC.26